MRYLRGMRRTLPLFAVALAACAAERARGPLMVPLGLSAPATEKALQSYDFCHRQDGPLGAEEMFPSCDRPGLGRGDAWVIARYDSGVLVGLKRFERWADPQVARERWDRLIAKRSESTPPSTGAREQMEARHPIPDGTQAWVAFSSGDELIGVYLLTPQSPDDPSILEEIVPAVE